MFFSRRAAVLALTLATAAWAKPETKTAIMYYTPDVETKLSVAYKHANTSGQCCASEWPTTANVILE